LKQSSPESFPVKIADEESDVRQINSFFNDRTIKRELHKFTYQPTLDRALKRDDRQLLYLDEPGEIIAALMVWCESRVLKADEAQIRLIAVDPNHRQNGIGELLCIRAEAFARSYDKSRMTADVASESNAAGFWENVGYSKVHSWVSDNGREMMRVSKSL
jgi:GNAT superfamily N-acetyltransferase